MTVGNSDRKTTESVALGVLSLIIFGLLAWMIYEFFDQGIKPASSSPPQTTVFVPAEEVRVPVPVNEFARFVENNPAAENMGVDHAYTSDGIRQLARAIGATADQQGITQAYIKRDLDRLRRHADQLQEDRRSADHADTVRAAFTLATDLVASIERQIMSNVQSEVAEARQAAQAIDPDKKVLDQKGEIETFFKKMDTVLNKLVRQKS